MRINAFRNGGITYLRDHTELTYCGLTSTKRSGFIGISQGKFAALLIPIDKKDFFGPNPSITLDVDIRKRFKAFVGGPIWLLQTRFDLAYYVVAIASAVEDGIRDSEGLKEVIPNCTRAYNVVKDNPMIARYHPLDFGHSTFPNQLLVYSDAGYNTLPAGGSIESFFIGFGQPKSRDGVVNLKLHPLDWQSRKMKRVVISSLAAESVALATSIDYMYWVRAVVIELFFGEIGYRNFNSLKPSPMVIPFTYETDSPHVDSAVYPVFESRNVVIGKSSESQKMFLSSSVGLNGKSPWIPLEELSAKLIMVSDVDSHRKIGVIVLTDIANAFSAVHAGNPRCQDRLTRLHLCYFRGGMDLYNLSFISEGFNLSDCGTKHRGNSKILNRVNSPNDCQIGFISRAAMKKFTFFGRS